MNSFKTFQHSVSVRTGSALFHASIIAVARSLHTQHRVLAIKFRQKGSVFEFREIRNEKILTNQTLCSKVITYLVGLKIRVSAVRFCPGHQLN